MTPNKKAASLGPVLILALCAAALFARCFFTFCQTDESFYLAITHRYWLGEAPLVDEWNPEQFYAALLLPFYSVFRLIVGSADGVYLAARLCFTAITCAMGGWIYHTLKEKNQCASLGAALLFMLYSKANIGGFSYYNVSLVCLTAGALLLYNSPISGREAILRGLVAGAVMALAVLCNPVAAVGWIILILPFAVKRFHRFRSLAVAIFFGTGISAIVYLVWLLGRISVGDIITAVPHLISDPEANTTSSSALTLLTGLLSVPAHFLPTAPLWVGGFIVTLWYLIVKRRSVPEKAKQWVFAVSAIAFFVNVLLSYKILGQAHTALCFFGLQCLLLTPRERSDRRALLCFFIPGIAFAVIWQASSNTRFSGMTIGFAMSAVAACGMVGEYLEYSGLQKKTKKLLLFLLLGSAVLMSGWQRLALEYRDAPVSDCTARISQGPALGLFTSPEHAAQYEAVYKTLAAPVVSKGEGRLMISSLLPWGYLCTERPCGAPSTWRTPLDNVQLADYYDFKPENFPTTVVVLNREIGDYVSTLQPEINGETNVNNLKENYMLQRMEELGYTVYETDAAKVYCAP